MQDWLRRTERKKMPERLSLSDGSLLSSYAENIQRHEFALPYCIGKHVLDAGCGSGYGSYYIASNGAHFVLGVDISEPGVDEARTNYQLPNLRFEQADLEILGRESAFDVVINFENIAYVRNQELVVANMTRSLKNDGTLVVSTPNGEVFKSDETGQPKRCAHFYARDFTPNTLKTILASRFENVELYGQWLTPDGMLRRTREQERFAYLCEAYYHPLSRLWRACRRAIGRKILSPPEGHIGSDSYTGDFKILPLDSVLFQWEPMILIAVCKAPKKASGQV
jgi:2-polyprenyl-3-methyl-5-hydroxy-6-metoxy-1,4-benzoquinol methylase